ncbi:MAG TPA: hypothetical protein VGV41_17915 [Pseudolabrys sp.]|uniref:hypothetical protein n=1 Tax=Pseudolabrys sp. TaxID=1960880 RepID=UPI002DDD87E7|nr:hypothetical protein [Pseudolabrys sp.]HEV2630508.1 hypothetical protein [Pseudolabrys sp.]
MAKQLAKKVRISKRAHVSDALVSQIRSAFDKSEQCIVFTNRADVVAHFGAPQSGRLEDELFRRISAILPSAKPSDFDTHDLRDIAKVFTLEDALAGSRRRRDAAILLLLQPLGAGSQLKRPNHSSWEQAATLGRALVALDAFYVPNPRHRVVAEAARRLAGRGYKVSVKHTRPWISHRELKRATAYIQKIFNQLGIQKVLGNLCSEMRLRHVYDFDQYLTGRRYSPTGHDASFPFGYLVNLAVKTPDVGPHHSDPTHAWRDALELARDLVAIIDVEPQNQFWAINTASKRLDDLLREIGLYDHLFGLKQWSLFVTPLVLRGLFGGGHNQAMRRKYGWDIDDAIRLCESIILSAHTDPARLSRADLMKRGLTDSQLDKMMPHFVYGAGVVNSRYLSPLLAEKSDLMFRPLIEGTNNSFIVPAASLAGPAFYEATMVAARAALPKPVIAEITGNGTERVTELLLRHVGTSPSLIGERYNQNQPDEGECDIVLEDKDNIVLIECKAKALTRAAMAGVSGYALMDYAEGVLAAQAQGLRHERLLRTNGFIQFDSGKRLEHRGRQITRLSVTLLEHGTLQDASLFWSLFDTILRSNVRAGTKHPRKQKIDEINDLIATIGKEVGLIQAVGHPIRKTVLGGASVNIGQLAIFLVGAKDIGHFVRRVNVRATANTGNPLLEFHFLKSQGMVD